MPKENSLSVDERVGQSEGRVAERVWEWNKLDINDKKPQKNV